MRYLYFSGTAGVRRRRYKPSHRLLLVGRRLRWAKALLCCVKREMLGRIAA
ncbi:hypothetical protein KCP69_10070 [Salmonella enterica subsp. enterica]|nr:hypothetical protein KCP69_10070 [Salmonella enterica subsp. enterica]